MPKQCYCFLMHYFLQTLQTLLNFWLSTNDLFVYQGLLTVLPNKREHAKEINKMMEH